MLSHCLEFRMPKTWSVNRLKRKEFTNPSKLVCSTRARTKVRAFTIAFLWCLLSSFSATGSKGMDDNVAGVMGLCEESSFSGGVEGFLAFTSSSICSNASFVPSSE